MLSKICAASIFVAIVLLTRVSGVAAADNLSGDTCYTTKEGIEYKFYNIVKEGQALPELQCVIVTLCGDGLDMKGALSPGDSQYCQLSAKLIHPK